MPAAVTPATAPDVVASANRGPAKLAIVDVAARPDLVPVVAAWLWHEFWHYDGYTLEQTMAKVDLAATGAVMARTFVALIDGRPVGTASLAADDLDERPHLTPWLAGVFVIPSSRRQGIAPALVGAVEATARAARIPSLWLYTSTAETLYARMGWHAVEMVPRPGKPTVTLMRRTLTAELP